MYTISSILQTVGVLKVAEVTNRTIRQVYKWKKNNTLPRTEFTGETDFASAISAASGGVFSKSEILDAAKDGRQMMVDIDHDPRNLHP